MHSQAKMPVLSLSPSPLHDIFVVVVILLLLLLLLNIKISLNKRNKRIIISQPSLRKERILIDIRQQPWPHLCDTSAYMSYMHINPIYTSEWNIQLILTKHRHHPSSWWDTTVILLAYLVYSTDYIIWNKKTIYKNFSLKTCQQLPASLHPAREPKTLYQNHPPAGKINSLLNVF